MFEFLCSPSSTGIANSKDARNAFQPQKSFERDMIDRMSVEINAMQKIVDALCKVYLTEHTKEIEARDFADKYWRTDQPIIDRARALELQHKIAVAQMELKELQRGTGVFR